MSEKVFTAGVGRAVITPPLSAPHAGWGAQVHVLADGVHEPLYATVLVVSDGHETAAYCELELVVITREESNAIRDAVAAELGIDREHVRCCISHNHAGPPPGSWNWGGQGLDALARYYELLPAQLAGAAHEAKMAARPALIAVGHGECHVAVNRRETAPGGRTVTGVNPDGPIDPDVLVVRIDGVDGEPIASIVGYTMHPTFLGPTNRLISSDWPGQMRKIMEQITGAPCLFAQGATGDIGPGPKGFSDDYKAVRAVGGQVGCEAARVYLSLDLPAVRYEHERIWESGAPLGKWKAVPIEEEPPIVRAQSVWIDLPLGPQTPLAEAQALVDQAQATLDRLKAANAPVDDIEAATFVIKRANMTLSRSKAYDGKTLTSTEMHMLQIGPVLFAGVEGEPFSATAKAVKEASPFPATWFGGYTGGWAGYVPTPEEWQRHGYEVDTSPFSEHTADVLRDNAIVALKMLASEKD